VHFTYYHETVLQLRIIMYGGDMKTMSLGSPMVIMVVGGPGAGKSFFARRFAETFGAPLVSEDKIRYTLFGTHTYSRDEQSMVDQVSQLLIDELFISGKTFLLDGGYNARVRRDEMRATAEKNGYRVLTVWVQTDEPTAQRRSVRRREGDTGDTYKQSMTPEQFETLSKAFTPPADSEKAAVVSGKHTYATQAKAVLQRIVASREDLHFDEPGKESASRVFLPR
jgi:predicted kinase